MSALIVTQKFNLFTNLRLFAFPLRASTMTLPTCSLWREKRNLSPFRFRLINFVLFREFEMEKFHSLSLCSQSPIVRRLCVNVVIDKSAPDKIRDFTRNTALGWPNTVLSIVLHVAADKKSISTFE